jgi:MFS transporter, DHA1 family, multidrug resistance protein
MPKNNLITVFILLSVSALAVMSNDMYIPSMPDLTHYFSTTESQVQLTLSLNLFALGVTQLLIGPLSDRFGRRPILLLGVLLMSLFSLACGFAESIEELIGFRVLQGMAAAVEPVLVLAILADTFEEKERVKVFAVYGFLIAFAPAIAPILGGFVHVSWGWQWNFYILASMGLLSYGLIYLRLKESNQHQQSVLNVQSVIDGYKITINNKPFVVFTLVCSFIFAILFAFITAAPFIYIDLYKIGVSEYGYYQAVIVIFFAAGSIAANRLVDSWGLEKLVLNGLFAVIAGGVGYFLLVFSGHSSSLLMTVCFSLILLGCGFIFAVVPSLAMRTVEKQLTGSASAVLGATEMLIGSVSSLLITLLFDGSEKPLAIVSVVFVGLATLTIFLNRKEYLQT